MGAGVQHIANWLGSDTDSLLLLTIIANQRINLLSLRTISFA